MKNKLNVSFWKLGAIALAIFAPVAMFAQTVTDSCEGLTAGTTLQTILCRISLLLNSVVPVLIVLGVVYFIYGVVSYAIAKDEEAKTAGRGAMINGLIALLVIVSIWGLVAILKRTFGITNSSSIQVPCIESPGVVCP